MRVCRIGEPIANIRLSKSFQDFTYSPLRGTSLHIYALVDISYRDDLGITVLVLLTVLRVRIHNLESDALISRGVAVEGKP